MQKIVPFLWFESQAEEACNFYVSVFNDSKIDSVSRYGEAGPGPSGSVMTVEFTLEGQDFMAINGGQAAGTAGLAQIALFVNCQTQAEVDSLWDKLSQGGETLQCGWLKDKYGFSWNIVPNGLVELVSGSDPEKAQRAMKAMLQMEKLDIDELRRAYEGR